MTIIDAATTRPENGAPPRDASLLDTYAKEHGLSGSRMLETLAQTIFPHAGDATPEHVHALIIVARQYGLNPFTREIYAFPAKGSGIVPVVSVDGWAKLVNQNPACEGVEISVEMSDDGKKPYSATCRIHRKGWKVPVEITEYHREVVRDSEPWRKQPVRMLRHRAFIQAARLAFGFGGIYEADEAARFAADPGPEHREVESAVVTELQAAIDAHVQQEAAGGPVEAPSELAEENSHATESPVYAPEVAVAKVVAAFGALGVRDTVLATEFGPLDRLERPEFDLLREYGARIKGGELPEDVFTNDGALALMAGGAKPPAEESQATLLDEAPFWWEIKP